MNTIISKKERNITFDIIKGIAIYLMVLGHCGSPGHKFIYLFHMGVFFIISGYFFSEKNYKSYDNLKTFIKRKVKSLYLPFIIINLFCILFHNFFIHINLLTNNPNFSSIYSGRTYLPVDFYSLKPIDSIRNINLPILFVHGDSDALVPCYMAEELYRNCGSEKKELLIIEGADHAQSFMFGRDKYESVLDGFLSEIIQQKAIGCRRSSDGF